MIKSNIFQKLLFSILIIFLCCFINCYTAFNHPDIYSESDADSTNTYYNSDEIVFTDNCQRCHEQEMILTENYDEIYESVIDDYDWQYYFLTPWWVDDYYYRSVQAQTGKSELPPTQKRDFGRGHLNSPPRIVTPTISRPTLAKPSNSESSTTSGPTKRPARRETVTNQSSTSKNDSAAKTPKTAPVRVKKTAAPKSKNKNN